MAALVDVSQPFSLGLFGLAVLLTWTLVHTIYSILKDPLRGIPGPLISRFSSIIERWYLITGDEMLWIHSLHSKYGPVVRINPTTVSLADPDDVRVITRPSYPLRKAEVYEKMQPGIITERDPKLHAQKRRRFGHQLSNTETAKFEPFVPQLFEDVQAGLGEVVFSSNFPLLFRIRNIFRPTMLSTDNPDGMFAFGRNSLVQYKKELETHGETKPTFFSKIMLDPDLQGLSMAQVEQEANEFMFAGSDTTSTSLVYLVWEVIRNPEVKKRVLEDLSKLPEDWTDADLLQLPYFTGVIHETLRLWGSAAGPLRRCVPTKAIESQGYVIPPGTELSLQSYTLHRSPKVFSEPERFLPERWINATKEMWDTNWAWGYGTRVCLGIHLATQEMRLAAAALFRKFPNIRLEDEASAARDMRVKNFLVNSPTGKKLMVLTH
ncbi:hypothetical protein JX265_010133 [Neoarthrinium moseri]|uniref:Cytochrome P450 n=1 Tax=Neoarthrinium moseri TaxID=1658444 RepID=A0A9P9WF05_9PEZI|nr:hypothetical protein JX265_010133 [Neoarthrinium moseri]